MKITNASIFVFAVLSVATQLQASDTARVILQARPATDNRFQILFEDEPGWISPACVPHPRSGMSVASFAANELETPSPLKVFQMTNILVTTLMICARSEAADLSTLIEGATPAMLRVISDGGSMIEHDSDVDIDSLADAFIEGRYRVFTVDFAEPVPLSDLFFGGSVGRPEWRRNWQGEIAEIIGFDIAPDTDIHCGTANYLANHCSGGSYPATSKQRAAAKAAGLYTGSTWMTIIMIR